MNIWKILQISWKSYSGSRVVRCGQRDGRTDRHEEANSRLSQLR